MEHAPPGPVGDLAVRRRIGYLPENPYFYDYLTAEELLDYFAGLFGVRAAERRARIAALLDDVGLGAERTLRCQEPRTVAGLRFQSGAPVCVSWPKEANVVLRE